MGAAGSLARKPLKMCGFFRRFVEREGFACLETAQLSGFGFPSLETPSVWLHCGTRGPRNGLRGLEFGAEAKDSGAVKIISNSCDSIPANLASPLIFNVSD